MTLPLESTRGTQAALQAIGLSKRYSGKHWALRGIDLDIAPGSVSGIVGPNAAGKSTLIRSWMGFERPTEGQALVLGRDAARFGDQARQAIGYVPQSPALYDGLSVGDHLRLAALLRPGLDTDRARRRLAGLGIAEDQMARSLSGGQRAQIALSLAVATAAPILLLDEPLADLDPLARRQFLQSLRSDVMGSSTTVAMSSHVVSDVAEACDRLIVLGAGRVLLSDSIARILATHRTSSGSGDQPSVSEFARPQGEIVRLHRIEDGQPEADTRQSTLEEVVLGYLALDRNPGGGYSHA